MIVEKDKQLAAKAKLGLTCVQNPTDHPRHHHQEHGEQFHVATHDAAGLDMGHVLAREASLDNDLAKRCTKGSEEQQGQSPVQQAP